MDTQTAAAVGVLAGMTMMIMVCSLAMLVLRVIAHWKIYTKAGREGWKSLIPIYSEYVLFDMVWDTKNFIIYICSAIATAVLNGINTSISASASGEAAGGNMFLSLLVLAAAIVCLVWSIRLQLKTAAAFGKGTGFAVGLILLPSIFELILAFGSAEYVGKQE